MRGGARWSEPPPLCAPLESALRDVGMHSARARCAPTRMFVTDASYSTERRDEEERRLVLYLHGVVGDPAALEARVTVRVEEPPPPYILLWRERRALDPLLPCALWRIGIYSMRGPVWHGLCAWMRRTAHRILRARVASAGASLGNRVSGHWVSNTPFLTSDATELHNSRKSPRTSAVLASVRGRRPARWGIRLYAATPPDIGMLMGALSSSNARSMSEVCLGGVLEYTQRVALDAGWGSLACWLDLQRIDWSAKAPWLKVHHFGECGRIENHLRFMQLPNPVLTRATYDLEVPGLRHIIREPGCISSWHSPSDGELPLPLPCGCGANYTDSFPDGSTPILSASVKVARGAASLNVCFTVHPYVETTPVVIRRACGADFSYLDCRVGSENRLLDQMQALFAAAAICTLVGYNNTGFDDWMLATRAAAIEPGNTRIWLCEHDRDVDTCVICNNRQCKHDIKMIDCCSCMPRRNELSQKMTLKGVFRFGSRNVGRALNVTKSKKGSKGKGASVFTEVRSAHGIIFDDVMIAVKDSPCAKEGGQGNGLDAAVAYFLKRPGKADMKYDHQIMAWQKLAAAPPEKPNKLVTYCMYDTWLTDELYKALKRAEWGLTLAQTVGGLTPHAAINRGHLDKLKPARERLVTKENAAAAPGAPLLVIKRPPEDRSEETFEGAYVFPTGPGIYAPPLPSRVERVSEPSRSEALHEVVAVLCIDFAGLYPACMEWWNLSDDALITFVEDLLALWRAGEDILVVRPLEEGETLNDYGRVPLPTTEEDMRTAFSAPNTYFFLGSRDGNTSLLAKMMQHMRELRVFHKKKKKEAEVAGDTATAMIHDLLQNAAKILMNAVYGAVGWGAISFGKIIAFCICCAGQNAIKVRRALCAR